ncbi:MAG: hypothetical protein OdinLCB4_003225 [Candidatus Odinarchaeum yellowstonii]|uniref:Uncharacterized protein n=1 Tax=Odinarchaeota yellowstonii (strain LCB_4) TaxID=1841599 RepID=A0AAF0D3C3_ODILC|nr:MAG: hypothetical protein OdinLCB4_003225 [Candidatus Odinarchaeum yellowstonii]
MNRFSLTLEGYVKREDVPLILRCLLDRIPVVIYSDDEKAADELNSLMMRLLPNRWERVFLIDFATLKEYQQILDLETRDIDSTRPVFRATSNTVNHIFEGFNDLRGWVVSAGGSLQSFQKLVSYITAYNSTVLTVKFLKTKETSVELIPNTQSSVFDVAFERSLIESVEAESKSSIERIKRVLKNKVYSSGVSNIFSSTLLNFEAEAEGLKESLFNSQIFLFVNACRRALYLLTRIDLVNEFNIEWFISEKTLLNSIKYNEASASRILDFIKAEWGLDFHKYVRKGAFSALGDIIEGLWG